LNEGIIGIKKGCSWREEEEEGEEGRVLWRREKGPAEKREGGAREETESKGEHLRVARLGPG
jgi:hypothetical protein